MNNPCTQPPPTLFDIPLGHGQSEAVWILEDKEEQTKSSFIQVICQEPEERALRVRVSH